MIRLKDKGEISSFFRVIAQESVRSARATLTEADRGLDDILGDVDKGKDEQKPAADASQQAQPKKAAAEAKPDTQPGPSADQTQKDYGQHAMKKKLFTIEDLEAKDVSLESLLDKLNTIRAGKSFKDQTVAAELEEYYNGLSSTARMALYTFLKGLAQLSLGEVDGGAAVKPGASPPGIQMTRASSDTAGDAPPDAGGSPAPEGDVADDSSDTSPESEPDSGSQPPEQEEEDDDAPIKVGTSANPRVEALRRHVRSLLSEGR